MKTTIDSFVYLDLKLCDQLFEMIRERFTFSISRCDDLYGMIMQNKKTFDVEFFTLDKLTYYDLLENSEKWNIIISGDDA